MVIDASVAIKWLVPEDDHEKALTARRDHDFIAPQLIYAECANIVWKKVRKGELTAQEARESALFIDTYDIKTVAVRDLVPIALDLSLHLDHAAYDCFYLALALLEDCPFLTADVKLRDKVHSRMGALDAQRCLILNTL